MSTNRRRSASSARLSLFLVLMSGPCNGISGAEIQAVVGGGMLLDHAIVAPTPQYPPIAIQNKVSGIAVALVTIPRSGTISSLRMLESPSPEISASVESALAKWRFKPIADNDITRSKIIFYFVLQNGKGVVLSPNDKFYVGAWPERNSTSTSPKPNK